MPRGTQSLRLRLFVRIVTPLMIVALAIGTWRTRDTAATANEIFDRNLTAVSIAVSRDVASSGGELLSFETLGLLAAASGGKVFYHVHGPDGAYVSGFGHPPPGAAARTGSSQVPVLFDSTHSGDPVRAASLIQFVDANGLEGFARITVWQKLSVRRQFARNQALMSLGIILALVTAVMGFVWFGVNAGLAPLLDLRDAIAQRSPQDLRPITRRVPDEVRALVDTLNTLFGEVRGSIESRDRFIANAAHQLRNPIAAVQALAEAALRARSGNEAQRRLTRTVEEARHTSHLAEQLLMLEKLRQTSAAIGSEPFDANAVMRDASTRFADLALDRGIEFGFVPAEEEARVLGDPTVLAEAVENLVDNALKHGGRDVSSITLSVDVQESKVRLVVEDDGKGIAAQDREIVFERFAQLDHGPGSGLGLSIVKGIALAHGGGIAVGTADNCSGARFTMELPLADGGARIGRKEAVRSSPTT